MREKYRTAKLWCEYLHYLSVLKKFIVAERTSNWNLHLESTKEMMNLFAASGHLNYAKNTSRRWNVFTNIIPGSTSNLLMVFTLSEDQTVIGLDYGPID